MKILLINSVCGYGSTGKLCTDIADDLSGRGHTVVIAYGRGTAPDNFSDSTLKMGLKLNPAVHGAYARMFDTSGFGSKVATLRLLQWVKEFDPDVIHLHNLHGYYINIKLLFQYLKTCNKRIIWTLHDCWAFTGHCCYFEYVRCDKWKTGCKNCGQKKEYPRNLGRDRSSSNYIRKKTLFCDVPNMTLVTPSHWLAGLVKESYLSDYPLTIIPNWTDTDIFHPVSGDFKAKYNLQNKKIVLGVASVWDHRKGLDYFLRLNRILDDRFQIVLVGLSKMQKEKLPPDILGITRTADRNELAEIYSAADIFVNPTLEDNYPATNLEAISCGTPVISFDSGGSGESARLYGQVIEKGNMQQLVQAIENITENRTEFDLPDLRQMGLHCREEYVKLLEGEP